MYLHKNLYINVYSGIIYNSQKVETTQMSTKWWMDKQNELYPYNGILFGHTEEWSTDTYYNIDEPWKQYAKWKRAVTHNKTHNIPFLWIVQNKQIQRDKSKLA